MFMKLHPVPLVAAATMLLAAHPALAQRQAMENPDFTRGGVIPEGATHDWNLGATGARGWIYSDRLVTTDARQIFITHVADGSPADGVLAKGDVVLGVGGRAFARDPRVEFGQALTAAESEKGGGKLKLTRWRGGAAAEVVVDLPVLGTYSATAPYDCAKSRRVLELAANSLAARMAGPNYTRGMNPMPRAINALGLLAAGNPDHLPVIRRECEWAAGFEAHGFQTWYYAYLIMLLAEYQILTGDAAFADGLRRLALESAIGQSIVGSWGHRFAEADGRLGGYGMMNAPGVPLTISMLIAREAGLDDPVVARAIERSARLLRFYIGKGAIPYGDHRPWTQTHEDNGKAGMAGVMFNFMGEADGAEFFSRMSVASHGGERDTGHTGNFTNILWAMPGVALSGPHATGGWMGEFGAWYFDLARTWDGRFPHQGPPGKSHDKYRNWDATGGYLLAYAMPLRKLLITGKQPNIAPQLDPDAVESLLRDGRGWDNKDRTSAYDSLDMDALLGRLGSWSPAVRERAAMAIHRHKGDKPLDALIAMLDSPNLHARYGACEALKIMRAAAAPAVPALKPLLDHDDLWLRCMAAEALGHIGAPAMSAAPILLERLTVGPTEGDPRAMEQRYLCSAVFGQLLKNSLDGVDRDLLRKAVAAGLANQDGRARGEIAHIYRQLTFEEIKPLLPADHDAIVTPSPSGIMFADGIRLAGLEVLAKHRIREGMALCLDILDLERWGKQRRIQRCLEILAEYGGDAKPLVPRLRQLEKDLIAHSEARMLQPRVEQVRKLITDIEAAEPKGLIDLPK